MRAALALAFSASRRETATVSASRFLARIEYTLCPARLGSPRLGSGRLHCIASLSAAHHSAVPQVASPRLPGSLTVAVTAAAVARLSRTRIIAMACTLAQFAARRLVLCALSQSSPQVE